MQGYIHSIESLGLVDGPGVRSVVFFAGCPLRCLYCHNPDSWRLEGERMEARTLVKQLLRFQSYWKEGGVTISGGEPLLQADFLLEVLRMLKLHGIHTCLDTAGGVKGDFREILKATDLILFDVKHEDPALYQTITGGTIAVAEAFLRQAQDAGVPIWIRHVVVPGLTDSSEHLICMRDYIARIKGVQKVELLPYHKLGEHKYELLGIPNPLKETDAMSHEVCKQLEAEYFHGRERERV